MRTLLAIAIVLVATSPAVAFTHGQVPTAALPVVLSCDGYINAGSEAGGYVESLRGIGCAKAKSVARDALRAGVGGNGRYDCKSAKTRHFNGWTIHGPITSSSAG